MNRKPDSDSPGLIREDGVVSVEFAILFPLFLLILVGILEFGHLFYVRHTLTNATREGARAAVMFRAGSADDRIAWATNMEKDSGSAYDTVYKYLNPPGGKPRLPGITVEIPTPVVAASSTSVAGASGSTVTVTINASNVSLVLGSLVDAFKGLSVSAQTTMKME